MTPVSLYFLWKQGPTVVYIEVSIILMWTGYYFLKYKYVDIISKDVLYKYVPLRSFINVDKTETLFCHTSATTPALYPSPSHCDGSGCLSPSRLHPTRFRITKIKFCRFENQVPAFNHFGRPLFTPFLRDSKL